MAAEPWEDVFRRPTREQRPDAELRRRCAGAVQREVTRLDVAYRLEREAVARARAEEAALLGELVKLVRPCLAALTGPLLILDVRAPSRPALVHLSAFLLFGQTPLGSVPKRTEACFLLADATFLRLRFTGSLSPTDSGRAAFGADVLEGLDARSVLRDHSLAELTGRLARGLAAQSARREAHVHAARALRERLQSVRTLLAP